MGTLKVPKYVHRRRPFCDFYKNQQIPPRLQNQHRPQLLLRLLLLLLLLLLSLGLSLLLSQRLLLSPFVVPS